jgi:hypothetical protein
MERLGMFTEPWHWSMTADAARDNRDADGRLFRIRITTILLRAQKMKRHCQKNVKKLLANCHEDHVLSALVYKTCGEIRFSNSGESGFWPPLPAYSCSLTWEYAFGIKSVEARVCKSRLAFVRDPLFQHLSYLSPYLFCF